MKKTISFLILIPFILASCVSTKSTIKNIDNNAIKPQVVNNSFVITEYSEDKKYGYNKNYPINIGFNKENEAQKNIEYYFNALLGDKNEKITFKKLENCCPFPTKRTTMGAGTLDVYEVSFENNTSKVILYFNIYEKGKILCPKGFSIKKQ